MLFVLSRRLFTFLVFCFENITDHRFIGIASDSICLFLHSIIHRRVLFSRVFKKVRSSFVHVSNVAYIDR